MDPYAQSGNSLIWLEKIHSQAHLLGHETRFVSKGNHNEVTGIKEPPVSRECLQLEPVIQHLCDYHAKRQHNNG